MGPLNFDPTIWPPVEPADRPARGDLELSGEKDRRIERLARRRQRQEDRNPDADEFRHRESEPEEEGPS